MGLERSGRIITSAAAIVILVSLSFAAADLVIVKALGVGMALAVLLDATLVRGLLVPGDDAAAGQHQLVVAVAFQPARFPAWSSRGGARTAPAAESAKEERDARSLGGEGNRMREHDRSYGWRACWRSCSRWFCSAAAACRARCWRGSLPARDLAPTAAPLPPVRFPQDEAPHTNLTEWWYYTGHFHSASGHEYGFELTFFQTLRGSLPPYYAAHYAISDISRGQFHYDQQVGFGSPSSIPPAGSTQGFHWPSTAGRRRAERPRSAARGRCPTTRST